MWSFRSSSCPYILQDSIESDIATWTTQRDALAAQIKAILEAAEFSGQGLDEQQAKSLIAQGQTLLSQAAAVAAGI